MSFDVNQCSIEITFCPGRKEEKLISEGVGIRSSRCEKFQKTNKRGRGGGGGGGGGGLLFRTREYAITSKIPLKLVPTKIMLKLFDAWITRILLYGREIWGALPTSTTTNGNQLLLLKYILSITEENTRSELIHYKHSC